MEEQTARELGNTLIEINQQLTILGITLGCVIDEVATRSPEQGQAIEERFRRLIIEPGRDAGLEPRAKALVEMLQTAFQSARKNG